MHYLKISNGALATHYGERLDPQRWLQFERENQNSVLFNTIIMAIFANHCNLNATEFGIPVPILRSFL